MTIGVHLVRNTDHHSHLPPSRAWNTKPLPRFALTKYLYSHCYYLLSPRSRLMIPIATCRTCFKFFFSPSVDQLVHEWLTRADDGAIESHETCLLIAFLSSSATASPIWQKPSEQWFPRAVLVNWHIVWKKTNNKKMKKRKIWKGLERNGDRVYYSRMSPNWKQLGVFLDVLILVAHAHDTPNSTYQYNFVPYP